ncbi:hypothetical protein MgSA37_03846 [Mucilaginibacter gotjawali]|uniref:Uncharacterized protein n=1 Tax=Mucilaginibacter gotjawali TaxID=1550579 RepID=A0A0X8X4W7_9SPHI|nr:hypothetical protein MgSA37_03846 [Mucilaginibacter gotjawali]
MITLDDFDANFEEFSSVLEAHASFLKDVKIL